MTTQAYIEKYCAPEWIAFYLKFKAEFEAAPAGQSRHHNFAGGLTVHTAEVIRALFEICHLNRKSLVEEQLPDQVALVRYVEWQYSDSDLVLAAFLHDFAKIVQYVQDEAGDWRFQAMTMPQETWTLMTLAQNGMSISEDLTLSLLYAEGGFSEFRDHGVPNSLAWLLHMADIWSSQLIQPVLQLPICPRCGKELRKRKGTRGMFWGCSGYPACSMTVNIETTSA